MFDVKIDLTELEREWAAARRDFTRDMGTAVAKACNDGKAAARVAAPHRTYELRDKIDTRMIGVSEQGAVGELRGDAEHSSFLRDGTEPHVIKPKNKQFLRFEGSDGKTVFSRGVKHPGTKPHGFWKKGEDAAKSSLERGMAQATDKLASKMSG